MTRQVRPLARKGTPQRSPEWRANGLDADRVMTGRRFWRMGGRRKPGGTPCGRGHLRARSRRACRAFRFYVHCVLAYEVCEPWMFSTNSARHSVGAIDRVAGLPVMLAAPHLELRYWPPRLTRGLPGPHRHYLPAGGSYAQFALGRRTQKFFSAPLNFFFRYKFSWTPQIAVSGRQSGPERRRAPAGVRCRLVSILLSGGFGYEV
ncbi:hypothetical protein ACVJGD_004569 [Bradyrhizobium sp. USDA 10063]